MTATDIKVGDLIKATNKDNPEQTFTGRVGAIGDDWFAVPTAGSRSFRYWDLEVLERPLPPVEEELLDRAIKTYREESGLSRFTYTTAELLRDYGPAITAVINTVREFDSKKESSK